MHELPSLSETRLVPRRFVDQGAGLAADFAVDPATDTTLVHTDLHYANVLAAEREPWLAIDPKPLTGESAYEVAPLLWNRWDELADEAGSTRDAIRRRFHTLVDAAGLDEARAVAWTVVRMVVDAYWSIEDAERELRPLGPEELERITRCVVIAKSVQD